MIEDTTSSLKKDFRLELGLRIYQSQTVERDIDIAV